MAYTRSWDFGDGNDAGDQAVVTHEYGAAGPYTVTLTLTDQYGRTLSASAEFTLEEPTTATASCEPTLNRDGDQLPVTVTFAISSSENITQFNWDFGGGDVVTGDTFSRTYDDPIEVSGTLTCVVDDAIEADDIQVPFSISIEAQPSEPSGAILVNFGFDRASGSAPFTFSIVNNTTTTLEGETLSYQWTVTNRETGAPQTSEDVAPTFTLDEPGTYDITVVVTGDGAGAGNRTATGRGVIQVTEELIEPDPSFSRTTIQSFGVGQALVVEVVDTSDQVNGGPIETWDWTVTDDTGDVLATAQGPGPHQFNFSSAGTYTIEMLVTGYEGRTSGRAAQTFTVVGGGTVTASFVVDSITALDDGSGYQVCFTNTSENAETSTWYFDFVNAPNQGVTNNDATVCTIYPEAQNYQVALVTTGQNGEASAETKQWISTADGEQPPIARFSTSTNDMEPGETVTLNNQSEGNVTSWLWELVNSDTGTVVDTNDVDYNASFTINTPGTYFVRLTAINSGGTSQAESTQIVVTAPEVQCIINGQSSVFPGQADVPYNVTYRDQGTRTVVTQTWQVLDPNGSPIQQGDGNNIVVNWDEESGEYSVVYSAQFDDAATCEARTIVTVEQPALTCVINGNFNLLPGEFSTFDISVPDNVQTAFDDLTYSWSVSGDFTGPDGSPIDLNAQSITLGWPTAGTFAISGTISANDMTAQCELQTDAVNVGYSGLECRNPQGDNTPSLDETVTYQVRDGREIRNLDGRDFTVTWELVNRDTNEVVATGEGTTINYTFDEPGARYRLTYRVFIDGEEQCVRPRNIDVATETVVCIGWGSGEYSPAFPGRNYDFRYRVDSGSTDVVWIWSLNGISLGETTGERLRVNSDAWANTLPTGDNYTLNVRVVDANDRDTVYCDVGRRVSVGQLQVSFDLDKDEVRVGEEVCLDNTSITSYNDLQDILDRVTWSWNFGSDDTSLGRTSDVYQPGCLSFNTPGEYRIRLDGVVDNSSERDLRGNQTRTVRVFADDRINVTASQEAAQGPARITFTASGENLVDGSYIWSINDQVFNRSGASQVSYFFDEVQEETQYTITVSAQGEISRIDASVVVTIFPAGGDLTANFTPDEFGVTAGSEVCFTDQSSSTGAPIVQWDWDFGNGQTVSFDVDNYQGVTCTTYPDPNTSYPVRLTVTNSIDVTASATNTIKTVSEFETRSSFAPEYQGGNAVCFVAQLDEGVFVTGWEYGGPGTVDTQSDDLTRSCYTYDEAGTYQVTMIISNDQTTGRVPRRIDVGGGTGVQDPSLFARAECTADGSIRLVVDNAGGAMTTEASVSVAPQQGDSSITLEGQPNPFTLEAGGRVEFFVREVPNGGVTFTINHGQDVLTVNADECWDRSSIAVTGECTNFIPTFYVSNTGQPGEGDMDGPTTWRLYELLPGNQLGQQLETDTVQLVGGETSTLEFPQYLGRDIRLEVDQRPGHPGSSLPQADVVDCVSEPPSLTASGICLTDGVPNGSYGFVVNKDGGPFNEQNPAPSYRVTTLDGEAVDSGTLPSDDASYSDGFNLSYTGIAADGLLLFIGDEQTSAAQTPDCYNEPVYEPRLICGEVNGEYIVEVNNSGGEPIDGTLPTYRITADGEEVATGTLSLPFRQVLNGTYDEVEIQLFEQGEAEPFASVNNQENENFCYVQPEYTVSAECVSETNGVFAFTVDNLGGEPLESLPRYTIIDSEGNVLVEPTTVGELPFETSVTGPYSAVTIMLQLGEEGEGVLLESMATAAECYAAPAYAAELTCTGTNGSFSFNVENVGGQPLPDTDAPVFEVVDDEGNVLQSGILEELPFSDEFTAEVASATLRVTTPAGDLLSSDDATDCYVTVTETPEPPTETPEPPTETPEPPTTVCGEVISQSPDGFPVINMDPSLCGPDSEQPLENWETVQVGEAICPDWLVYHTDRTGDWELFRLGELPGGIEADPNLSQAPNAIDMAPSRSPDGRWIAFASSRDGNWEIYIAQVEDPANTVRRVTINEDAIDLDPVWSPDGTKLAYESTVDGNWEIRMVDLLTGEKWRLTDHPANDINPFWHPDGTQLIFQSDRVQDEAGVYRWQMHTIDLSNGFDSPVVTRIEGQPLADNHDAQFADNGAFIAFRSYVDDPDGRESAVYILNVDGTGLTRVSELGGDARHQSVSPNSELIAYQSNIVNGINDIYVYEIATGETRLLTNNEGERYEGIQDVSPTWFCESTTLVFASDVPTDEGTELDNNIFSVDVLPIDAPPINTDEEATQLTQDEANDRDPQNSPPEENASRQGALPPRFDG
ncbi:MAG: PKD domain-containing protein [Chloroflexota bacterium]